ncbi:MAG: hypothetical protein IJH84_07565 [Saccharopolyspora sp.]|uniref:NB-ARC domain-containing protein n=1 Tax=Saccharopolyspora sp. TaxID=33915 RepID=UPI0025F2CFB3|nr:NB-ARC domain-containing protein [Saccharopolyspora sp.]MBQ6640878.1 hypothetical protein [Saccharopolyspora sp.]
MSERSEGDDAAAEVASTSNQVGDHVGLAMQVGGSISGGLTINTGGSSSVRPSTGDSLPIPAHSAMPRPELLDELIEALRGASGTGLPTGVTGDSGFGKTTLATMACRDARVAESFPDGVLWTTIGYDAAGPDLATKLNELSERLSGSRPSFTGPDKAGEHLGNLVADKRCLLVIDDVWRRSQLEPFAAAGTNCRKLVTTRFPELLAQGAAPVTAGAMQPDQAQAVLCAGWSTHHPDQVDPLLARTHGWPLMLALANRAVHKYVNGGRSLSDAARKVADRLSRGAQEVDRTAVTQRCDTASAMIELNLSLLGEQHRQRCFDLAIFPGDAFIPPETLRTYWGRVAGMTADAVEDLLARLDELALVQRCWVGDAPAVQVHDVVGDYLRKRVGAELPEYHRAFLGSFQPKSAGKSGSGAAAVSPESDPYLRAQGHFHRRAADRSQPGVQIPASSALARESAGRKASRGRRVRRTVLVGVPAAVVLSAGVAFAAQLDVGRDGPPAEPPPVRQMPPAQIPGPPPATTPNPAPTPEPPAAAEPPPQAPPASSAECDRPDCDLPARSTAQAGDGSLVTLGSGPGTVHRYVQSSAGTAPEPDGDLGVSAMAETRPVLVPDRNGRLVGFVTDTAGRLLYNPNVEPGVPSQADDWKEIATGMSGTPAAAQDRSGNLVVITRDSGGSVWRLAQNEGWKRKMLDGTLTDEDPKVHRDDSGFLRVFVLDRSHYMRTWAQEVSGDFKFREPPLGNAQLHSPPAVMMIDDRLVLFALDGNRALRQLPESRDLGPNQWPQEWYPVPELPGAYTGLPIVASDESGAVNIFVRHQADPSRVSYARLGGIPDELGTRMQPMLSATLQGGALVVQGWRPDGAAVVSEPPG